MIVVISLKVLLKEWSLEEWGMIWWYEIVLLGYMGDKVLPVVVLKERLEWGDTQIGPAVTGFLKSEEF